MEKSRLKSPTTNPSLAKPLKEKLFSAVHKVLKDNKAEMTDKIQKIINKSIEKIVKRTDKQIKKVLRATK
jgi:hypothetical protein